MQRALAGVREADQGHVGHELQLELAASAPRPARPARRSWAPAGGWRGSGRCPGRPGRRRRPPTGHRGGRGRPGSRRSRGRGRRCPPGRATTRSSPAPPCWSLPLPWAPLPARRWGWSRNGQERGHVAVGDQPDVAAVAPVAPVGPALATGPSRRNDTQPAPPSPPRTFSCALVDEPGHGADPGYRPAPARPPPAARPRPAPPALRRRAPPSPARRTLPVAAVVAEFATIADTSETFAPAEGLAGPTPSHPVSTVETMTRVEQWAATMAGHDGAELRLAHADSRAGPGPLAVLAREEREARRGRAAGTRRHPGRRGAGDRARPEEPDPCAHLLRARPRPHPARHRLPPAGRQDPGVRVPRRPPAHPPHPRPRGGPGGHGGRRARCGLNVALTEAIALGHDCGHGPGGHASEDALAPYVAGGYDHAVWGADVVLDAAQPVRRDARRHPQPLVDAGRRRTRPRARSCRGPTASPTCATTSRTPSRPASSRPTCCPPWCAERCGSSRRRQLGTFIDGDGRRPRQPPASSGWDRAEAEALAEFRRFNYEHIYLRPASVRAGRGGDRGAARLVEHYADRPNLLPADRQAGVDAGSPEALRAAVTYVGGMTDRFACQQALALLGWDRAQLPKGSTSGLGTERQLSRGLTSTSLRPLPLAELHRAVREGEQRVVAAAADVVAGVELGAALAHDDRARRDGVCRRTPSRRGAGRWSRARCGWSRHPWSSTCRPPQPFG